MSDSPELDLRYWRELSPDMRQRLISTGITSIDDFVARTSLPDVAGPIQGALQVTPSELNAMIDQAKRYLPPDRVTHLTTPIDRRPGGARRPP